MLLFSLPKLFSSVVVITYSLSGIAAAKDEVVQRDVAIIGGGAAGIYAAIRLRDAKKTVAVVEQQSVIGGHTETYTDTATGKAINLGVTQLVNQTVVTDFLKRLNIQYTAASATSPTSFVDFSTGEKLTTYQPTPAAAGMVALQKFVQLQGQYPTLQKGFNLTYPVADDLLLPFGQFVTKYALQDLLSILSVSARGYAPLLDLPTIYIMKKININEASAIQMGYIQTASGNLRQIYDNAASILGSDIWLGSSVHDLDRSSTSGPIDIRVDVPNGRKVLRVKKIIVATPPTAENMKRWDNTNDEQALWTQFISNGYYTGLLKNTGVAAGSWLQNVGKTTTYNLPNLPGLYSAANVPGTALTSVLYASADNSSSGNVQSDTINTLKRVVGEAASKSEFVSFANHAPFNLRVTAQAIRDGFYRNLLALQGKRHTFYAGAAWQTTSTSAIWEQIDSQVLPSVLAAL